jgi:hypothetical protein
MEPFSELHAGRVARRADQVAAVVHVHVQVAAIPSVRGGIDQPHRLALDGDPFSRRGSHLAHVPVELEAPGAHNLERLGRHGEGHVVAVEERSVVEVPLRQDAVREPGPAARIGDRPASAVRGREGELCRCAGARRTVDRQNVAVRRDGECRVRTIEIDRLDRSSSRRKVHLPAGDRKRQGRVTCGVDDDVDRDRATRDRGEGRPDVGPQRATLVDSDNDDSDRHVGVDHASDRLCPVARRGVLGEDGPELREAGPSEEVDLLVPPVPSALVEEATVLSQRLDHRRRQRERVGVLAAHVRSLSVAATRSPVPAESGQAVGSRELRTQNSLPSGSASTTHDCSPWPTSTRVAPKSTSRFTSASRSSGRKSR